MAVSDEVKGRIGKPLGKVPSGVYILTAAHGGKTHAMLASWVQQAAFDPPTVSVALAKDRPIYPLIRESKRLALSILGEHDTQLMKKYARGIDPGRDAFEGMSTVKSPHGIPCLADALGWIECRVISVCEFGGDHDLILGEVVAAELLKEGLPFKHSRGNGFHY
jgi:3-hydroxy-9,10-secoandrosta-1,3,5(10)-triene-9,17-dione monooxygenase reductase component